MEASSTKVVGNNVKLRKAYEFAEEFLRDYGTDWKLHNILCDMLKSALAEPPRACDLMTEEELSQVVSRSIVASVSSRPELNEEWIKSLVGAAATAAIKCAYYTKPKSSKKANNDD